MSDKAWRELLLRYLTGELTDEDQAVLERFLAEDAACRAALDEWEALRAVVRDAVDARVDALPAFRPSFYERLHSLAPSQNGSHTGQEDKIMTTLAQPLHKTPKRSLSATLAAALLAVIAFTGAVLLARGANTPETPEHQPLAGLQAQTSATPVPTETATTTPTNTATATPASSPTFVATASYVPGQPPVVTRYEPYVVTLVPVSSRIEPIIAAPARLSSGLTISGDGSVVDLDVSPDGKLLVVYRVASTLHSLWLADLSTGEQTAIFIYDVPLVAPTFSADGTQIFVSTLEGRVFVLDISR